MSSDPKITPCLWFDGKAEEAAQFYTSLFPNARILETRRYGENAPFPKGSAMSVTWEIEGQRFMGLNGGPMYTFSPAISLFVGCETQDEVDRLWSGLLEGGGKPNRCAWLTDRYGVSWQIVPKRLGQLLQDPDPAKAGRVMKAMLGMNKIDIAGLEAAAAG